MLAVAAAHSVIGMAVDSPMCRRYPRRTLRRFTDTSKAASGDPVYASSSRIIPSRARTASYSIGVRGATSSGMR